MLEAVGLKCSPEFMAALALTAKEQLITGGVRGGKSTNLAAKIWVLPRLDQPMLVWIVGPTYEACQTEMWYLYSWASKFNLIQRFVNPDHDSWMLILKSGAVIETRSAQHPERLASVAPDAIFVTEAGQCPPTIRTVLLGRALEKNATIVYGGTIETDDNKPRFAWFEQLAVQWLAEQSYAHQAAALPSWSNLAVFNGIDPDTGELYIDPETGEPSGIGEYDYRIQRAKANSDAFSFARIYAGQPIGSPYPAYPELTGVGLDRLQSIPDGTRWLTHVGGGDWGVVHPWTLVVVGVSTQKIHLPGELTGYKQHVAWVRECVYSGKNNGDSGAFNQAKRALSRKYGILRWGVDPVQTSLADNAGTEAVLGNAGSRDLRIGLVRSRLRANTLLYDISGAGVSELYSEQKAVHYRMRSDGKFELVRMDDDRTAALEDAIFVLDSAPGALPFRAGFRAIGPRDGRASLARGWVSA